MLANYAFDAHKAKKQTLISSFHWIGATPAALRQAKQLLPISQAVFHVRNLVNGNADTVTPAYLAAEARKLAKRFGAVRTTVWGRKQIEKAKMGLILAVARGSKLEPKLIVMKYRGAPKSKEHTVLVGKGVTYDTGGLDLKPSSDGMKGDMAGAATVLGTMEAVAASKAKVNLTVVIPSVENAIDANSYKTGDVYSGYSGKTVEVGNTDAEGRLILADALAYTVDKLKPTRVIDLATLTGAVLVALGQEAAGLMSNHPVLQKQLLEAGDATYERVCALPLYKEYKKLLKSDIADIKNVGGRHAGSITAGLFLQEFVGDIPWAHIDIAGTAYRSEERGYLPKYATGYGVRLLFKLLVG